MACARAATSRTLPAPIFMALWVPFATELMKLSRESGMPIKIRACDTLGFGVTYPGVAMPRSVQGIMYGLHHYADVPSHLLESARPITTSTRW